MTSRLPEIATVFGVSSLLSIGGANTIVPHLQEQTVLRHPWLTDRQFVDCFAIAQVTPGPNTLLATLLGYRAGGILGAAVAMTVPAVVLAVVVARFWLRIGKARWHHALEHGLAPLGVGLVGRRHRRAGGQPRGQGVDLDARGSRRPAGDEDQPAGGRAGRRRRRTAARGHVRISGRLDRDPPGLVRAASFRT